MAEEEKHIAIVGGGLQGSQIAYFLRTKFQRTCTILEQSDIAAAASGKGGGFLAASWGNGPTRPLHEVGFALHAEQARDLGISSYRQLPTFQAQTDASRPWSGSPPWLRGRVRVSMMDKDTAQVHPHELCTKAVAASGAAVVRGRAIGVQRGEDGSITGVTFVNALGNEEVLPCDIAVFTLGPWSSLVEEWMPGVVRVPMSGIKSSSVVIELSTEACELVEQYPAACFCSDDSNGCHLEIYPRNDGTVYLCGLGGSPTLPPTQLGSHGTTQTAEQVQVAGDRVDAAIRSFTEMAPSLMNGSAVRISQACLRPILSDALPMMGRIEGVPNGYISCGHNCWGILWSTAQGLAMAELIETGKSSTVNLTPFSPARFATR